MAQSRRALLRLDHPRAHPPWRLHLAGRTRNRHPRVSRQSQRRAQAFRVDQIGRPNPCQSGARTQRSRSPPKCELTVKLSTLACQFLGIKPSTIEVNPFLADLIEAKLSYYNIEILERGFAAIIDRAPALERSITEPFPNAPKTFVEPGDRGRFLFLGLLPGGSRPIARQYVSLNAIRQGVSSESCLLPS